MDELIRVGKIEELPGQYLLDAAAELSALRQRIAELEGERDRLRDAVLWALGENGRFAPREENDPPYWWRKELRRRAALER